MGTNYYAHILPSKQRKMKLHYAIDLNDFDLIQKLVDEMYGSIEKEWETQELIGGRVHLGKGSYGWKFLWNPNIYVIRHGHLEDKNGQRKWVEEPNTGKYIYPLTKQGLHDFIFREDVLVYDEYHELQDKEEFWQMALSWGYDKDSEGWDAASYEAYEMQKDKNYRSYPVTGELTDFLNSEGYEFTSWTNSDFYSDGLRFAGYVNFS
jgi:hypothetical protein